MSRRKLLWQNLTFVQESERGNNKFSAVLPQFQNTAAPVKNGVIGENMRSKYWQFLTLGKDSKNQNGNLRWHLP